MRKRITPTLATIAAVMCATVVVTVTGGQGAAAGPGVSVTPVEVKVMVGPGRDTRCRVVADLYVPETASAARPQPAVLTTHGFGGSKADQAGLAKALAAKDYVVLAYSGLGFGGSQCKVHLDHPDWDGRAASGLVDYLAGLDVVRLDAAGDPRVGMFGGSYGGGVQFAVASIDRRIDAIVPAITWHDLSYALAPNNVARGAGVSSGEAGVLKRFWTDLFAVFGVLRGIEHAPGDPRRLIGCPNFADWVCPTLIEANLAGYVDAGAIARLREASVASYVSKVQAPTLILQGQDDTLFNLQEAAATYRALLAQGTPVRMIWHKWGHSGQAPAPGEFDLSGQRPPETTYLGRRLLDWYAYWLRDDHSRSLGPPIAYFRDWIPYDGSLPAGAEPAYASASALPIGGVREMYLSGNRTLTPDRAGIVDGSQTWANLPGGLPSSYSEIPPGSEAVPPSDTAGTFGAWTSASLAQPIDTVGMPTIDIRFHSAAAAITQRTLGVGGRLVVFAKLYDVAPDGSLTLVHRLVSPVRVPDVNRPLRIELPGIVHRWQAGHRIRVVLAASDAAYAGNVSVLPVSVRSSSASAAVLRLPML